MLYKDKNLFSFSCFLYLISTRGHHHTPTQHTAPSLLPPPSIILPSTLLVLSRTLSLSYHSHSLEKEIEQNGWYAMKSY